MLKRLPGWHYKNDQTHVVFFSRQTFEYLAERDKLDLEFIGNDVILLRKSPVMSRSKKARKQGAYGAPRRNRYYVTAAESDVEGRLRKKV